MRLSRGSRRLVLRMLRREVRDGCTCDDKDAMHVVDDQNRSMQLPQP